ncbi:hypothetical protein TA3x_002859 [Tundrisphaera sp. TA3]|uniref:hypothetical protein n=1 Tax=Tundrisphaera sp. TA3 TaxID=3435775 RepID=UPI003EB95EF5
MPWLCLALSLCLASPKPADPPLVIVVEGAPGTPEYGREFRRSADLWEKAAARGSARLVRVGEGHGDGSETDRDRLRAAMEARAKDGSQSPSWLVLIGHGTWDGREARFNLRGPDLSDAELAEWLKPIATPIAIVNGASASGPFLPKLSAPNRVIVTATRSGDEQNFARFGLYLAEAIADPAADIDKDGQTSLLEAFLKASAQAQEYYRSRSRLATEHALIDDNGDKLGTPADWFRGIRATKRAKDGAELDGLRANQRTLVLGDRDATLSPEALQRRDQIEVAVASLRSKKTSLAEDEYYRQLEALMLELARLYKGPSDAPIAPTSP